MKKVILTVMLVITTIVASAQVNLQLHYDLGRTINSSAEPERPNVTTTVEMFKADKLGSTFFFVDMDYYSSGVAGAYWEISREFNLTKLNESSSIAAHVEYNGGLLTAKDMTFASRFQPAALVGGTWNWHNADFSSVFSLQVMYKHYFQQTINGVKVKAVPSFQITPVWSTTFADGKMTFSGFADLWYGYIPKWEADGSQKKGLVFITEPQLWYNATSQLSIGTEVEISNNFIYSANNTKFIVNPTLALKWKF